MKNYLKLSKIKKLSDSQLSKVKGGGGPVKPLYGVPIITPKPLYGITT
jgi:hypothetical protein